MAQENEIKILVEAEVKRALKNLRKTQKESETLADKFKKVSERMKKNWVAFTAGVAGSVVAIKKAFDFSKEFAAFNQATTAMRKQFGKDADEVIKSLKRVSDGTISNAKLVEGANRAMALNVTKDIGQMSELLEVARFRAQAMGISTTQAFDDIVTGIGRQSPLILDNLGIITKGWAEEAKAAGVAFDQQFMLNKILKQGSQEIKDAGGVTLTTAERMQQMGVAIENVRLAIGEAIAPLANRFVPLITTLVEKFTKLPKKITAVGTALTILIPVVITIGSLFGPMALAIAGVTAALGAASVAVMDFRTESEKLADTQEDLNRINKRIAELEEKGGPRTKKIIGQLKQKRDKLIEEKKALEELIETQKEQENQIKKNIEAREKEAKQAEEKAKQDAKNQEEKRKKEEAEEALASTKKAAAKELFNVGRDLTSNLFEHRIQALEGEKQAIQDKVDAGLISEEEGAKRMQAIDKKISAEKRKQAIADKAFAISQVVMQTAVGIMGAWAKFGNNPITAPIAAKMTAILSAMGAAQTAVIASQPIPAFAMGTDSAPGGRALVGEAGPEMVDLAPGSVVTSNHELMAKAGSTTNNNTENFDNRNYNITVEANDPQEMIRKIQEQLGQGAFA